MLNYKDPIVEGNFLTTKRGFRDGQRLYIQSDIRSIDDYYLINSVTTFMISPHESQCLVKFVSTRRYGIIEALTELYLQREAQVAISADAVAGTQVDKISTYSESFSLTDGAPVYKDRETGPWYVAGGVATPIGICGFCQAS